MRRFACAVIVAVFFAACTEQGADPRRREPPAWVDYMWAAAMGHDTEYTTGYSDATFNAIKVGASEADVERLLGSPFGETWIYGALDPQGCDWLIFHDRRLDGRSSFVDGCGRGGIRNGMSAAEVRAIKGTPTEIHRCYSRSPGGTNYWTRCVATSNGVVTEIDHRLYWD